MASFVIKFGSVSSVSGSTEDWGVSTVTDAVKSQRARVALNHPDKVLIFVNDVPATGSQIIRDMDVINLQREASDKGLRA